MSLYQFKRKHIYKYIPHRRHLCFNSDLHLFKKLTFQFPAIHHHFFFDIYAWMLQNLAEEIWPHNHIVKSDRIVIN
jgi:hypothetical protein